MPPTPHPVHNRLLAALPRPEQQRLFSKLELVELKAGAVVYEAYDRASHFYFPIDCILATLYEVEDGECAESSIVGNEGFAGIALLLGGESTPNLVMVQHTGFAYRAHREVVKSEFDRQGAVHRLCLRYIHFLLIQTSQTAVCNRHHSLEQQLCRSLLVAVDRLHGKRLRMTQQLLADVLGVRRPSVTHAAGRLQKLGLIAYRRGAIDILDHAGLEALCCECYGIMRSESERMLSQFPSAAGSG